MVEQQQNRYLNFVKHQMSYLSFRQKGKIHEAGASRAERREKYFQLVHDRHLHLEHPIGPPIHLQARPGFFPFSRAGSQVSEWEANCPGRATNHCLSWDSTPVSASLWQGSRLTLFIALLQQRLTNWTQPRKTKEL